jgi:hypothetical protein
LDVNILGSRTSIDVETRTATIQCIIPNYIADFKYFTFKWDTIQMIYEIRKLKYYLRTKGVSSSVY